MKPFQPPVWNVHRVTDRFIPSDDPPFLYLYPTECYFSLILFLPFLPSFPKVQLNTTRQKREIPINAASKDRIESKGDFRFSFFRFSIFLWASIEKPVFGRQQLLLSGRLLAYLLFSLFLSSYESLFYFVYGFCFVLFFWFSLLLLVDVGAFISMIRRRYRVYANRKWEWCFRGKTCQSVTGRWSEVASLNSPISWLLAVSCCCCCSFIGFDI